METLTIKFYILKEDKFGNEYRHYFSPEPVELKDAKNQVKWGMKKGIISLMEDIRTTTTYWEI